MANSYFWACDFKENSGEGKLARLFVKYKQNITNKKFIQIKAPKLNMLNYKYFSPIVGIFYCWVYFFKKRDIYYINFLPFWNVILFIFYLLEQNLVQLLVVLNLTEQKKYNKKKCFSSFI